jgi:UDP:flavonoid glycosyltransferase YjiC (YdhE family)
MRVLIGAVGSHGDTLPFIGLAAELGRRGHEVRLYGNASFEPLARDAGVAFTATSSEQEARAFLDDPRATDPRAGLQMVAEGVTGRIEATYRAMAADVVPGHTLLAGSTFAFAPRLLAEACRLPFAAVHLAPSVYRSEYLAPRISPLGHFEHWPRFFKRWLWRMADRRFLDPLFAVPLNEIRARLGLAPVTRVMHDWIHEGTVNIGAFPAWLAPRQPDWPAGLTLTGFPMYDGHPGQPLPQALEAFIAAGPAPIVFTAGTANAASQAFYEASTQACRSLSCRGILVAQRREQLPPSLPPGVVHAAYAPFGRLFPRAAAVVHHGGIGTLSQAFKAGVPQLIQPMAYDQFDNASRACRLGVARELLPRAYRAQRVAAVLDELIRSPDVRAACGRVAADMARDRGLHELCDAVLGATAG